MNKMYDHFLHQTAVIKTTTEALEMQSMACDSYNNVLGIAMGDTVLIIWTYSLLPYV
jgi:hypothetical protein